MALKVDFSQQILELQQQGIEDLNIPQKVPHVKAINISENPVQSWAFLTQFPNLRVLHADAAGPAAVEQLFRFLPASAQTVIIRFNNLITMPVLCKELPNVQQLDLSGNLMQPAAQPFAFYLLPNLRQISFGALPKAQLNSFVLLDNWLRNFAPNLVHATQGKAVLGDLRVEAVANKVVCELAVKRLSPDVVVRNCPVLVHLFNMLTGFEINYLASIETDLANILKDFQLELTQFMKFPANQIPNQNSHSLTMKLRQLQDMRMQQLNRQNYIVICVEFQDKTGVFIYDIVAGELQDFSMLQEANNVFEVQVVRQSIQAQRRPVEGSQQLNIQMLNEPAPLDKDIVELQKVQQHPSTKVRRLTNGERSLDELLLKGPATQIAPEEPPEIVHLPDLHILPLRPRAGDQLTINDMADVLGVTWYCTQAEQGEMKEQVRQLLKFNNQNQNVYMDGYFFAAVHAFNSFIFSQDNSHNNILVSKGENFIYLVAKHSHDHGIPMKVNLVKLDTTIGGQPFCAPAQALGRMMLAQVRYPWGFRCYLQVDFVHPRQVLPAFEMRFQNPFLQFTITPPLKKFSIQVFKNNVELIQLQNQKQFDLIELTILQAGYPSVEDFIQKQSKIVPRLDGLYSAVLMPIDDEGFQHEQVVYAEDIYLRGEIGGDAEEGDETLE